MPQKNNLLLNQEMFKFASDRLHEYLSPEIIADKWNSEHSEHFSYSSVYRVVRAGLFPGVKPQTHFRRRGKPYSNQKKSYTRYFESSIHNREQAANDRTRIGDFEGDTVYGSVGKGYLITAVDRRSRLLVAEIAKAKTKEATNAAFISAFAKAKIKIKPLTMTLDNGTVFLAYKQLENKLGMTVYFADTHTPWQRGSNENLNGLIRFFFPKGTNFNEMTEVQLQTIIDLINNRPRKCLNYLSPNEFLKKCCT